MVYSSDFYTTRRPYTRPISSSYTISTFDDEAKDIRAQADSLRRRINIFVPRHIPSDYAEVIVPERMRSDDYVHRLLTARKNDKKDVTDDFPWYRTHMGDGNLACVKYVGGRPQSRRRPYYTLADCIPGDVKNDVNLLSYYLKNRQAAANASKGWRDRVPELYAEPSKSEKKEEDGDPTEQEE